MAWEKIDSGGRTRRAYVAVTSNGLRFNRRAAEDFNLEHGQRLNVLIDKEGQRIGLQLVSDGEYRIIKSGSEIFYVNNARLKHVIPEGKYYLEEEDGILVASLLRELNDG